MTTEQIERLRRLHHQAVKAAQVYEAATPGTQTKRQKLAAWERAEAAFSKALEQ